jgi:hypothetical protein
MLKQALAAVGSIREESVSDDAGWCQVHATQQLVGLTLLLILLLRNGKSGLRHISLAFSVATA